MNKKKIDIPDGYYEVTEGVVQKGDLFLGTSGGWIEARATIGSPIHSKDIVVRPLPKTIFKVGEKTRHNTRPNRSTVISHDDIINLKIILNVTHSVEEFTHLI